MRSEVKKQRGASIVEYSMLVAFIASFCIQAVQTLGVEMQEEFDAIVSAFDEVNSTTSGSCTGSNNKCEIKG